MSPKIDVEKTGEGEFHVRVSEGSSESSHHVTARVDDCVRLAGYNVEPRELVQRSFEFLLEREPKESILAQFDLRVIGQYFPEYEREIKRRLSST